MTDVQNEAAEVVELSDLRRGSLIRRLVNLIGECVIVLVASVIIGGGLAVGFDAPVFWGLVAVGWIYVGGRLWAWSPTME